MDGRMRAGVETVGKVPVVSRRLDAERPLPWRWRWFAAMVGPVVAVISMAIEPPPADPNAAPSAIGGLVTLAVLTAWVGAAATGLRGDRQALLWAGAIGALSLAMTISCPTSGHHAGIGAWWAGQMAVSGGALAIAVAGVARFSRR